MTEICPKFGVHNLYTPCTHPVVTALLALGVSGGAAKAEIWDEFQTRCLTPLEDVALSQPADLTADKSFKNDGDTYSTYALGSADLAISDGRAERPQWCYIATRPPVSVGFNKQARVWRTEAIDSGRYEVIEERAPGFHLRSTEWREPRLDVTLSVEGEGSQVTLRVEETDLEG